MLRPATPADASRIAEIIVTNYRVNFYPIFKNEAFYFDNTRGIAFYERNGFSLTGEKIIEDEWVPLLKMKRTNNQ